MDEMVEFSPNRLRLRAWIYFGVETELEMVEHRMEVAFAQEEEDKRYHHKQLRVLERKMELINSRIKHFEELQDFSSKLASTLP